MKPLLFTLVIMGLAAINGHAQEQKCVCVKKTVHHTTHHRKTTQTAATHPKQSRRYTFKAETVMFNHVPADNKWCVVDSNGDIEYVTDNAYLGYYPGNAANCDINELLVTHHKDLIITSSAFVNNGPLPSKYTCQGQQASPPLSVNNIPQGTVSLAVIAFDPYATAKKSATYWLMWDLDVTGDIPENFASDHESVNPYNLQYGYQGVCPIAGTHYYHFRVYALDTKLLLDKHTNKATLENAMNGHILAKGELIGLYNKHLE